MTGIIRLYSLNGCKIRQLFYISKEDRAEIIKRWMEFYGDLAAYYLIVPEISKTKIIPIKPTEFINKSDGKPLREIEMPDYVGSGILRHETYFHRCYYKNE